MQPIKDPTEEELAREFDEAFGESCRQARAAGMTGEAKVLAEAAKAASRAAVAQACAAGLSIVVAKNGKLVRIAPGRLGINFVYRARKSQKISQTVLSRAQSWLRQ